MYGTDQDGTTNNLVLYITVQNDTSKKGGEAGLQVKKEENVGVF